MYVLVEELLCQAVTGRNPVLEYPLSGAGGPGSRGTYPVLENPQAWLLGARVYAEPEHEDKADWANKWQNHARPWLLRWGERTGADYSQV
jgi:hypothetical protein